MHPLSLNLKLTPLIAAPIKSQLKTLDARVLRLEAHAFTLEADLKERTEQLNNLQAEYESLRDYVKQHVRPNDVE